MSQQTYYRWRKKYGSLMPSEVMRLKQLEEESRWLKQMVADLSLDKAMLQDVLQKIVRPANARGLVDHLRGVFQVSIRRACDVLMFQKSSYFISHADFRRPLSASVSGRLRRPVFATDIDAFMFC